MAHRNKRFVEINGTLAGFSSVVLRQFSLVPFVDFFPFFVFLHMMRKKLLCVCAWKGVLDSAVLARLPVTPTAN